MRADRLLTILSLLQVHRRLTSRELAERLEVSQRTIHRDMEALSAAGVPVYAQRGVGGGWVLEEAYRTDLTGLNETEIRALFLARPAHHLSDLGLRQAAEGGLSKLLASLPSMQRRSAEYMRQRIHIDAGWGDRTEAVPALATIQEGVWQERKLHLVYRRSDGAEVERCVDPLGLVIKGNIWYLVAAMNGEILTYRVSRVHSAALSDEPAERPPGFDLAECWQRLSASFKANLPRYPVMLRARPEVAARVRSGIRFARIEVEEAPDPDGWVPFRILFEVEREACEHVLSMGPNLQVVEPISLRERVADVARRILDLH